MGSDYYNSDDDIYKSENESLNKSTKAIIDNILSDEYAESFESIPKNSSMKKSVSLNLKSTTNIHFNLPNETNNDIKLKGYNSNDSLSLPENNQSHNSINILSPIIDIVVSEEYNDPFDVKQKHLDTKNCMSNRQSQTNIHLSMLKITDKSRVKSLFDIEKEKSNKGDTFLKTASLNNIVSTSL